MTELSSDARSLLARAGATHEPRPADQERVRKALAARLAGGVALAASTASAAGAGTSAASAASAASAGTTAATGSVAGLLVVKATAAGFLMGTLTMVGLAVVTSERSAEPARARVVASAPSARRESRAAGRAETLNPSDDRVQAASPPPLPMATATAGAGTASPGGKPSREASLPGARVEREDATSGSMNSDRNATPSSSVAAFVEPAAAVGSASARPEAPRSPGDSERLTAEARALADVQRALDQGSPTVALELLSRHERQFAGGALGQERAAARVFVLCALGRKVEAQRAGARFLATAPQSPLSARVKAACAQPDSFR